MKSITCLPSRPSFVKRRVEGKKKQTFCKNAQWMAKKLRERGSSTARPTEKGGGGLPIRSRFGRFGRFRRVVLSISARRHPQETPCRHPADTLLTPCRHPADTLPTPRRHPADFGASFRADSGDTLPTPCRHQRQDTKKPDSSIGGSGSAIARCRALLICV